PEKLPSAKLEPVIDAPVLKEGGTAKPHLNQRSGAPTRTAPASVDLPAPDTLTQVPPAAIRSPSVVGSPAKSPAPVRPPMPDLTDLLPEGFPVFAAPPAAERLEPTPAQFADVVDSVAMALAKYDQLPRDDIDGRRAAFTDLHAAVCEMSRVVSLVSLPDADL